MKKTITDKKGKERRIHPSGQEARVYGDIDLTAISSIQAPLSMLPEIKKGILDRIEQTDDTELKKHLEQEEELKEGKEEVEELLERTKHSCDASNAGQSSE